MLHVEAAQAAELAAESILEHQCLEMKEHMP